MKNKTQGGGKFYVSINSACSWNAMVLNKKEKRRKDSPCMCDLRDETELNPPSRPFPPRSRAQFILVGSDADGDDDDNEM